MSRLLPPPLFCRPSRAYVISFAELFGFKLELRPKHSCIMCCINSPAIAISEPPDIVVSPLRMSSSGLVKRIPLSSCDFVPEIAHRAM